MMPLVTKSSAAGSSPTNSCQPRSSVAWKPSEMPAMMSSTPKSSGFAAPVRYASKKASRPSRMKTPPTMNGQRARSPGPAAPGGMAAGDGSPVSAMGNPPRDDLAAPQPYTPALSDFSGVAQAWASLKDPRPAAFLPRDGQPTGEFIAEALIVIDSCAGAP